MSDLLKIKGLGAANEHYLLYHEIRDIKELAEYEGYEEHLKAVLRLRFPTDTLPSLLSLQNWVQQAKALINVELEEVA